MSADILLLGLLCYLAIGFLIAVISVRIAGPPPSHTGLVLTGITLFWPLLIVVWLIDAYGELIMKIGTRNVQ